MKGYSLEKFEELAKLAIKIGFQKRYGNKIDYDIEDFIGKSYEKRKELATFIKRILREKDQ
jgi:hypothetical protein